MRVEVYWNLHRREFSIKSLEEPKRGIVVDYSSTVLLRAATPRVSESGRRRVLRDRKRNVHAGIRGTLVSIAPQEFDGRQVRYNPYEDDTFVFTIGGAPYTGSGEAYFHNGMVYVRSVFAELEAAA
jgi:hypothetical protein